ncbi:hypothetical protein [Taibaiella koreensis]|uniref:hypothetical protein n=1 Tax=Taibaiella koreensis TaxID=1268548 RepID=UPI000E59D27D|nr:hypothetical protein [Taibaiella koreensis]
MSKNAKKVLKEEVTFQLEQALGKLKDFLGERKFNSRVKKAVKLLTAGIDNSDKPARKEEPAVPPQPKKASPRKTGGVPVKKRAAAKKKAAIKKPAVAAEEAK